MVGGGGGGWGGVVVKALVFEPLAEELFFGFSKGKYVYSFKKDLQKTRTQISYIKIKFCAKLYIVELQIKQP